MTVKENALMGFKGSWYFGEIFAVTFFFFFFFFFLREMKTKHDKTYTDRSDLQRPWQFISNPENKCWYLILGSNFLNPPFVFPTVFWIANTSDNLKRRFQVSPPFHDSADFCNTFFSPSASSSTTIIQNGISVNWSGKKSFRVELLRGFVIENYGFFELLLRYDSWLWLEGYHFTSSNWEKM